MAGPQSLEEVIRKECLPLRDCMLTITDAHGEAAFLYFKEGELIEANYAALWGKEALAQIVAWTLAERTVAPLPLGIKRSLWDPLEALINPGLPLTPTASGKIPTRTGPTFNAQRIVPASPFDRFKSIEGLTKMIQIEKGKSNILFEAPSETAPENTDWIMDFASRATSVGDTLGFGVCEKWNIDTERYQVVGLNHDNGFIVLMRPKGAFQDDLDTAVTAVIE